MSLNMECFGLQDLIRYEDETLSFLKTATETGKYIRAYTGFYCNKHYEALQIIVSGRIDSKTGSWETMSTHSHCAGNGMWRCRVIKEITPEDSSDLDMRLLIEPVSGVKSFTVLDVMNADILPSFAPGEIIDLQMIAKARSPLVYANEEAFICDEKQRFRLPLCMQANAEDKNQPVDAGYPLPAAYMNNHYKATGEEDLTAANTDADNLVYLRGKILRRGYYKSVHPKRGDDNVIYPLACSLVNTYYGKIHIMYDIHKLSLEQGRLIQNGNIISTVCTIQGDALSGEYENGYVISKKNNLMAVRYAFSSGRIKRLLPIMADDCDFYSEAMNLTITGKEAITDYLSDRYLHNISQTDHSAFYGSVTRCDAEADDRTREYCVVLSFGNETEHENAQLVFLESNEEGKIRSIVMSEARHYQYRDYRSWIEMEEDCAEKEDRIPATMRKEKILTDFLNHAYEHDTVKAALRSILDTSVVLDNNSKWNYKGAESVMRYLEDLSAAISPDTGYTARPVMVRESEIPEFEAGDDGRILAVALYRKNSASISGLFVMSHVPETGRVNLIKARFGNGFKLDINHMEELDMDYLRWDLRNS